MRVESIGILLIRGHHWYRIKRWAFYQTKVLSYYQLIFYIESNHTEPQDPLPVILYILLAVLLFIRIFDFSLNNSNPGRSKGFQVWYSQSLNGRFTLIFFEFLLEGTIFIFIIRFLEELTFKFTVLLFQTFNCKIILRYFFFQRLQLCLQILKLLGPIGVFISL